MVRITTVNGDAFAITDAEVVGADEHGVDFSTSDTGSYWLTPAEARQIATALVAAAERADR
jgi:hypothetical protein